MRNVAAVATRELRAYFLSPLAYIVTFLFLLLSGLLFFLILNGSRQANLQPTLQNISVLLLFLMPAICMRLLSEELRSGTVELLLTNPIQEWEIVLGKFLGAAVLVGVMLVLTLLYPLFLIVFGNPDRGPILTGYVGVVLQAAGFIAVGLFASSLSQNQVIAALIAFALLLVLWLSDNIGQFIGGAIGTIVSYTSVTNHFQQFPQGVINSQDVVYFLTLTLAGLALTTLALQARRIR
jgi:ABC-2 type transport system permease protein